MNIHDGTENASAVVVVAAAAKRSIQNLGRAENGIFNLC